MPRTGDAPPPYFLSDVGGIRHMDIGTDSTISNGQIKQARLAYKGYPGHSHVKPDEPFLQITHPPPPAASKPNALPPLNTIACILSALARGESRPVSRVAVPPPRISSPVGAPLSQMTTVHPVPALRFSACPIRIFSTSLVEIYRMAYPLTSG